MIGSSPRMRGTQICYSGTSLGRRFIPAHAGNTSYPTTAKLGFTVHPRACGQHVLVVATAIPVPRFIPAHAGNTHVSPSQMHPATGSSPRMRGTLVTQWKPYHTSRFIPAHAGNTVIMAIREVHQAGSSPRMRGTPPAVRYGIG